VSVVGYLVGVLLCSLASTVKDAALPWITPARVAIGVAAVSAAAACLLPKPSLGVRRREGHDAARPRRTITLEVLGASAAPVLLLRAADAVRQVYLPLYALRTGVSPSLVSALFAVTCVAEILVMAPLAQACERFGSRATLIGVSIAGTASFGLMIGVPGLLTLVVSQALYAVLGAGFQSVGMVLLADAGQMGLGGSASAYTALVQLGSTAGVLMPLAVPGYSVWVLSVGAGYCLLAATLLACGRWLRTAPASPPASLEREGKEHASTAAA
jgi:MFS family permease